MKRTRCSALFLLAAFWPSFVALSGMPRPREDGPSFRVPYRMSETLHLLVRLKLGGKGPFNFIVDTGAPTMFVTKYVAKTAGVEPGKDGWATFDKAELEGGATLDGVKARVEDIFQIRGMNALNLPGVRLDGVIGYTVLAKFRMEFDLSKSVMTWTKLDFEPPLPVPLGDGKSAPDELEAIGNLMQGMAPLLGGAAKPTGPRGSLGLELAETDDAVKVAAVHAGSPAHEAGIKPGDRIAAIGGKSVRSINDATSLVATVGVGDVVKIAVERGDDKIEITAKAGKGF